MNVNRPTLARTVGSSIAHNLNRGTADGVHRTMCGLDATLMARWNPADANTDRRVWKSCKRCQAR